MMWGRRKGREIRIGNGFADGGGVARPESAKTCGRHLLLYLVRSFSSENWHGNVVRMIEITFHLCLQIFCRSKTASDCRTFPDRCSDCAPPCRCAMESLVETPCVRYGSCNRVCWKYGFFVFFRIGKFPAVVCLNGTRRITEPCYYTFYEVTGWVIAVFSVRMDEPLSASFFYHRILVKLLAIRSRIAGCRHIFDVYLLLYA